MSASAPSPTGGAHPLRSALKSEEHIDKTPPASGSLKAVHIAEPVPEAAPEPDDDVLHLKQFRAGPSRRLSGRFSAQPLGSVSSRSSLVEGSPSLPPVDDPSASGQPSPKSRRRQYYSEKLLAQVGDWLEHERRKAAERRLKPARRRKSKSPPSDQQQQVQQDQQEGQSHDAASLSSRLGRDRAGSIGSQSSEVSLDRLQRILEDSMSSLGLNSLPQFSPSSRPRPRHRKSGSRASLYRANSSDTDYLDGDVIVPGCDVWIDNSKTMSYSGGGPASAADERAEKDREAWRDFKNEIIRTAHTLKLKGWRRVPLGSGDAAGIERLSGALTNAVYVVTPPPELPGAEGRKPPPQVLLRIYGPQVEQLIDRDNELKVLQRLARKKIGPRLLGTFKNGRFEEFFKCTTLTPADLRDPDTSRQIAKRMRELHDGIELLLHERENGPGVWRNWDAWLDNVGRIVSFLDGQVEGGGDGLERRGSVFHAWKANGYVCGVPWPRFRDMVARYRAYLNTFYKNRKALNDRLIFAHNDTQYGNILRLHPDDEKSPLLQAANKHKQLVVIDFEYAAANHPGLEFANHFTEWTYNYHDATAPHACNTSGYPSPDEQRRFLKAYVDHRPRFPHLGTGASTPQLTAQDSGASGGSSANTPSLGPTASSSSIVDFMLDARVPPGGWSAAERARDEQSDQQVRDLMDEARLWRPANSAQWVAWGIVQATVPGLEDKDGEAAPPVEGDDEGADEFDYLSYAQDRALFFWGDCVLMGLIRAEELPEGLRARLKVVDY